MDAEAQKVVRVFYYVSKLLGLVTFDYGEETWILRIIQCLIFSVIVLLNLGGIVSRFVSRFCSSVTSEGPASFLIKMLVTSQNSVCYAVSNVMLFIYREKLNSAAETLIRSRMTCGKRSRVLQHVLVEIYLGLFITVMFIVLFDLEIHQPSPTPIVYGVTLFANYIVCLQFASLLLLVKRNFEQINCRLEVVRIGDARGLQAHHEAMCDTAHVLNTIYSPSILLSISYILHATVYSQFFIVLQIPGRSYSYNYLIVSYVLLKLFVLTLSCQNTATEVSIFVTLPLLKCLVLLPLLKCLVITAAEVSCHYRC